MVMGMDLAVVLGYEKVKSSLSFDMYLHII
jgi:hypothetical protein